MIGILFYLWAIFHTLPCAVAYISILTHVLVNNINFICSENRTKYMYLGGLAC